MLVFLSKSRHNTLESLLLFICETKRSQEEEKKRTCECHHMTFSLPRKLKVKERNVKFAFLDSSIILIAIMAKLLCAMTPPKIGARTVSRLVHFFNTMYNARTFSRNYYFSWKTFLLEFRVSRSPPSPWHKTISCSYKRCATNFSFFA